LRWAFGAALLWRLLFPFFDSPLTHLWSDPQRHWENGQRLFNPSFMGSSDPFLYQVWLYVLSRVTGGAGAGVAFGVGLLCALMPYGWYRALRELLPKHWALGGGLVIALVPSFISGYAYFMNETLLMTLTGYAFWATLRAQRCGTLGAFTGACALWLAAGFTRSVALPMALLCLLIVWLPQAQRLQKAVIAGALLLVYLIPAALHADVNLHFFAPFGNPYLNEAYAAGGHKDIAIDLGVNGRYGFRCPSFNNPTFYPFSDWTTDRTGVTLLGVDLSKGREPWQRELARIRAQREFSYWRDAWENLLFLSFGQSWPDNDRASLSGWLAVWSRWLWPPLILFVAVGALKQKYHGREWLLPVCALGMLLFFMVQQEAVMEARFRKPLDPLFVAAAVILLWRYTRPRSIGAA
jgi:hypothetical protein